MAEQVNSHELTGAVKDALQQRGSWSKLKANVLAEIFLTLESTSSEKLPLSNENLLINELIRDYLEFNGYRSTLSVLLTESGQPSEAPFERSFLANQLGLKDDQNSRKLPLIYSMVAKPLQQ